MNRILIIVTVPVTLLGSVLLYNAFTAYEKYKYEQQAESWLKTQGKVRSAVVGSYEDIEETSSGTRVNVTMYVPAIYYEYEVDGKPYKNDRYGFFTGESKKESSILQLLKKYEVGGPVTVYFNPDSPGESILTQQGAALHSLVFAIVMLIFGIVSVLGAIVLLILGLTLKPPSEQVGPGGGRS